MLVIFRRPPPALVGLGLALGALWFASAARADSPSGSGEPSVQVHGFVSQGFIKTDNVNYLAEHSRDGSFQFTEAGINFTAPLSDKLTAGVQIFAHDIGSLGNYRPQFDWYYLDYHFRDWLGFRAGRTKIPFGLYNETSDIDAARVPVLLPQSVYPVQNRDYLLAQTGGEIYGDVRAGDSNEFEYHLYGGTIHIDTTDVQDTLKDLSVKYVAGGKLMWLTPLPGLQIGGSAQALSLRYDYAPPASTLGKLQSAGQVPADFSGTVNGKIGAVLWVGSLEYTFGDWLLAAEYSRWYVHLDSSLHALIPKSDTVSERYYVMASYHVTKWFTPGVYYSDIFPNTDIRSGRSAYQHDVALTLRYDFGPHWLLKLEGHYMRGTASLDPSLNGGTPLQTLPSDWGLFVLKTTAYF